MVEVVLNTTRTASDKAMVKMVVLAEAADRMQEQVVVVVIPVAAAGRWSYSGNGGGDGSYNSGSNKSNYAGNNSDHGKVVITYN